MKIEKQVCNLKLATELAVLGIKQISYFYWGINSYNTKVIELTPTPDDRDIVYSAFTVSELGEMITSTLIGSTFWLRNFHAMNLQLLRGNEKENFRGETEADCRAMLLIYLIKSNPLIVKDINDCVVS